MPMRPWYLVINRPVVLFHSRQVVDALITEYVRLVGDYIIWKSIKNGTALSSLANMGRTGSGLDIVSTSMFRPHQREAAMLVEIHFRTRPVTGKFSDSIDVTVLMPSELYRHMALYVSSRLPCADALLDQTKRM